MTYVYQLKNYVNIWFWRKNVNVVHAMCCLTTFFFFSAALMLFIIYIFAFYMCLYSQSAAFILIHACYCILLALLFCVHMPTLSKAYLLTYLMTVMFVYQYIPYNNISLHNKEEIQFNFIDCTRKVPIESLCDIVRKRVLKLATWFLFVQTTTLNQNFAGYICSSLEYSLQ